MLVDLKTSIMYLEDSLKEIRQQLQKIMDRMDSTGQVSDQEILDQQGVLELLKISPRTLVTYRQSGKIPFTRIGGKIYYKKQEILELLEKNRNGKQS